MMPIPRYPRAPGPTPQHLTGWRFVTAWAVILLLALALWAGALWLVLG